MARSTLVVVLWLLCILSIQLVLCEDKKEEDSKEKEDLKASATDHASVHEKEEPRAAATYGHEAYQEVHQPMPYKFGYEIDDPYNGQQHRHEVNDEDGVVRGSYGYQKPDGQYRVVDYVADKYGFRAKIRTNEHGVANQDPADVKIEKEPGPEPEVAVASPGDKYSQHPEQKVVQIVEKPQVVVQHAAPVQLLHGGVQTVHAGDGGKFQSAVPVTPLRPVIAEPVKIALPAAPHPPPRPVIVETTKVAIPPPQHEQIFVGNPRVAAPPPQQIVYEHPKVEIPSPPVQQVVVEHANISPVLPSKPLALVNPISIHNLPPAPPPVSHPPQQQSLVLVKEELVNIHEDGYGASGQGYQGHGQAVGGENYGQGKVVEVVEQEPKQIVGVEYQEEKLTGGYGQGGGYAQGGGYQQEVKQEQGGGYGDGGGGYQQGEGYAQGQGGYQQEQVVESYGQGGGGGGYQEQQAGAGHGARGEYVQGDGGGGYADNKEGGGGVSHVRFELASYAKDEGGQGGGYGVKSINQPGRGYSAEQGRPHSGGQGEGYGVKSIHQPGGGYSAEQRRPHSGDQGEGYGIKSIHQPGRGYSAEQGRIYSGEQNGGYGGGAQSYAQGGRLETGRGYGKGDGIIYSKGHANGVVVDYGHLEGGAGGYGNGKDYYKSNVVYESDVVQSGFKYQPLGPSKPLIPIPLPYGPKVNLPLHQLLPYGPPYSPGLVEQGHIFTQRPHHPVIKEVPYGPETIVLLKNDNKVPILKFPQEPVPQRSSHVLPPPKLHFPGPQRNLRPTPRTSLDVSSYGKEHRKEGAFLQSRGKEGGKYSKLIAPAIPVAYDEKEVRSNGKSKDLTPFIVAQAIAKASGGKGNGNYHRYGNGNDRGGVSVAQAIVKIPLSALLSSNYHAKDIGGSGKVLPLKVLQLVQGEDGTYWEEDC